MRGNGCRSESSMTARMPDLPMGIGWATYTLCLYRRGRPYGVRQQTLAVARAGRGTKGKQAASSCGGRDWARSLSKVQYGIPRRKAPPS